LTTALLDLNVFLALVWPAHEHHHSAHEWFKSRGKSKWASCPLTQLGVVRLLSNPAFSADALTLDQALVLLKRNLDHPLHEFWPDSLTVPRSFEGLVQHVGGHRQTTDIYLLGLAIRRSARLATFDTGVKQVAVNANKSAHVELIR
jgi:toxin-antitoxin system PIN domain toxin